MIYCYLAVKREENKRRRPSHVRQTSSQLIFEKYCQIDLFYFTVSKVQWHTEATGHGHRRRTDCHIFFL